MNEHRILGSSRHSISNLWIGFLAFIAFFFLCSSTYGLKIHRKTNSKEAKNGRKNDNNSADRPSTASEFVFKQSSSKWEETQKSIEERLNGISGSDSMSSLRENTSTVSPYASSVGKFFRPVHHAFLRVANDAASIMNEVRPVRDVWDGILEALPIMWRGYYHGFESLLDYSSKGLTENGLGGLFFGLVEGSLHWASMTATGAMAGIYQGIRGIERTLESIHASKDGKTWDSQLREWFYYNLDAEAQSILSNQTNSDTSKKSKVSRPRRLRRRVKDSTYYEVLNVPIDANSSEIRKAYFQLALEVHPDKSNDLSAEEQFRQLNSIYKTLMSDDSRALYDQHGSCYITQMMENTDSTAQVNPYIFFSRLFGSSVVELYVGDLAIASIVDNILLLTDRADSQFSETKSNVYWEESPQQVRRQVHIASHLRYRIDSYVSSNEVSLEDFQSSCRSEAQALAAALYETYHSATLLQGISAGLIAETTEYLVAPWARPMLGSFFEVRDLAKNIRVDRDLDREVWKAMRRYKFNGTNSEEDDNGETSSSEDCKMDEGGKDLDALLRAMSVPSMWRVLLQFNANDVARTVREATKRVLLDCDPHSEHMECGGEHRLKKAQALNALGRGFHSAVQNLLRKKHKIEIEKADADALHVAVKAALLESVVKDSLFMN